MADFLTASLGFALLVSSFSISAGQRNITAEPGDNVILTCRAAENKDVIAVEWSRTDLESDQPVLLYRDSQLDPEIQSPSFRNRVDLLDVKNRDVSLVLKNMKTDDTGTYECRVVQGGNNRRKRSILDTEPICIIDLRVEAGQKNITAEPGDNVILTCRAAENKDVIDAEWRRTDLESDQFVLLYKDKKLSPEAQSPSFRNRVNLLDVENRDVSLVLKNVTADDTERYECRIDCSRNNRRKRAAGEPISTVYLTVEAGNKDGGNKDGLKEDGGNKDGQKEDGGNEDRSKEDGGSKTGLIVGVPVCAVVALLLVGAVFYKRSRYSSLKSKRPTAAAEAEKKLTGPDE